MYKKILFFLIISTYSGENIIDYMQKNPIHPHTITNKVVFITLGLFANLSANYLTNKIDNFAKIERGKLIPDTKDKSVILSDDKEESIAILKKLRLPLAITLKALTTTTFNAATFF